MVNKVRKILLIGPSLEGKGGISSVLARYIDGGLADRINLVYIPTYCDGGFISKLSIYIRAFFRICTISDVFLGHIHVSQKGSFFRKYLLAKICIFRGIKVILHVHGSSFIESISSSQLLVAISKKLFQKVTKVLVLSEFERQRTIRVFALTNVEVIYNPAPETLLSQPYFNNNAFVLLFMGRVGERKGVFDLLSAVSKNKDKFQQLNIKIIIAGDGEVMKAKKFAVSQQISDLVQFPGWVGVQQRYKLMNEASALILPSYHEQMPMSILEAMAAGKTILASRVAGIPEMVSHGINGYLFDAGDISAMAELILSLARDRPRCLEMGRESLKIVKKKFDTQKILNQLVGIYENVL